MPLETADGTAYHQKTDVYRRLMWYSYSREESANFIALSVEKVKEIVEANKKGEKIKLENEVAKEGTKSTNDNLDFKNVVGQESISRFDENRNRQKHNRQRRNNRGNETNK
jgi:hypothetical protein